MTLLLVTRRPVLSTGVLSNSTLTIRADGVIMRLRSSPLGAVQAPEPQNLPATAFQSAWNSSDAKSLPQNAPQKTFAPSLGVPQLRGPDRPACGGSFLFFASPSMKDKKVGPNYFTH